MVDGIAMIAIASCGAMTLERSRPDRPTRILSPAPAPSRIRSPATAIAIVSPVELSKGRGGMDDGVVSPPPRHYINIFIYIIFITLRAIHTVATVPA
jgi:hypothetical protein